STSGDLTFTVPITIGTGTNRAVVIDVSIAEGLSLPARDIASVTVGGVFATSLTGCSAGVPGTDPYFLKRYVLLNPVSGGQNIVVTMSNVFNSISGTLAIGATSYSGVNQTTPMEDQGSGNFCVTGSGTAANAGPQAIVNGPNDLGLSSACHGTEV